MMGIDYGIVEASTRMIYVAWHLVQASGIPIPAYCCDLLNDCCDMLLQVLVLNVCYME